MRIPQKSRGWAPLHFTEDKTGPGDMTWQISGRAGTRLQLSWLPEILPLRHANSILGLYFLPNSHWTVSLGFSIVISNPRCQKLSSPNQFCYLSCSFIFMASSFLKSPRLENSQATSTLLSLCFTRFWHFFPSLCQLQFAFLYDPTVIILILAFVTLSLINCPHLLTNLPTSSLSSQECILYNPCCQINWPKHCFNSFTLLLKTLSLFPHCLQDKSNFFS